MRGVRGFLGAGLALIALQTVVANPPAQNRLAGLADLAGQLARRLVDPAVPAFGAAPLVDKPITSSAPARNPARDYPAPGAVRDAFGTPANSRLPLRDVFGTPITNGPTTDPFGTRVN
jgi:hypothetical protein